VKVRLVPSNIGDANEQSQSLSTYLFNDTIAIDAGCLGNFGSFADQVRVRNIFLTHSHIDHTGSLPIFIDTVFQGGSDCVTVHASKDVLDCLQRDMFNDRVWPDFIGLSTPEAPFLQLSVLEAYHPVTIEGLRFTPIPVDHVVPTFGYIVESTKSAVVVSSDTGPTKAIWERANATPNLKAVFLEASFPEALAGLATKSKHLTPAGLAQEVRKLSSRPAIIAVHLKSRFYSELVRELQALSIPNLEIGRFDKAYEF
jgi:ribonuclease BN (tRNA processing enzyme)